MKKHTHREYLMWIRYLDKEWNQPSRTDYYLMQIAAKIQGLFSKNSTSIKIANFLLPFKRQKPKKPPTQKELVAQSKARWKSAVGYKD